MTKKNPFNPLDKRNLGNSVARAMLEQIVTLLPPESFEGAGIYAIYYRGSYPAYGPIAKKNRRGFHWPIYVGKAVPAGARKGGVGLGLKSGKALYKRLREHAESIDQAANLDLSDFRCRYLIVDDIWIPLGESLLVERFQPVWNKVVDGFGNHTPGSGRYNQQRSLWDVLHPGRFWATKCAENMRTESDILQAVDDFVSKHGSHG